MAFPDVFQRFLLRVPFADATRQGRNDGCIAAFFAWLQNYFGLIALTSLSHISNITLGGKRPEQKTDRFPMFNQRNCPAAVLSHGMRSGC